jgi:predicted nucleic acid-binding protein
VAKLFLPDNTVLINFAIIQRIDLLAELINQRGTWCISVARECKNSATYYPNMADAPAIFGTPLFPDRAERIDTENLRTSMAGPGDPATRHLGEAETVAIMNRRQIDGFFLTDDQDAKALAAHHGIPDVSTWDLLRLAYRTNKATAPVLAGYLKTLKAAQRGNPPGVTNQHTFHAWLARST